MNRQDFIDEFDNFCKRQEEKNKSKKEAFLKRVKKAKDLVALKIKLEDKKIGLKK
jgi:hypothetical protein